MHYECGLFLFEAAGKFGWRYRHVNHFKICSGGMSYVETREMNFSSGLVGLISLFVMSFATPNPQMSTVTISPTTPAATVTIIVTASPAIPSDAPQFRDNATFASAVLDTTNFVRQEFNATALAWNQTLADFSSSYLWSMGPWNLTNGTECNFSHSGGPYGENLALGCTNVTGCVNMCK